MNSRIWCGAICAVLFSFAFHSAGLAQSERRNDVPAFANRHSYNVLEYDLFMDWYGILSGTSTSYAGIMQIKFVPDLSNPLDMIEIDNNPEFLIVDSAFANGQRLSTEVVPNVPSHTDGMLGIKLDKNYAAGDTGIVELYYHAEEQPADSQKGFYYFYKGEQPTMVQGHPLPNGYTVPRTLAYTMSEPSDAHDWMPCYDDPSDKALCRISIRVPNGYIAASNGTLQNKVDNQDGSTTFNWSEDYPIATYLMCATAAQFSIIEREYTTNDGRTIPIQYYVYPEDSVGALSSVDCNIDTVASMIRFYESIYGPFPFDKYGMTGIEPFYYGGMEHQTMTTLIRRHEFERLYVAHELAHQWWGDMVTLGTWNDIWLNEGFATYSEAMQLQHLSESDFENEMKYYEDTYFQQTQYAIYAPQAQGAYLFDLAEYYKGAWVLHMLRNIVGDSTFFAILRTYRSEFQYGNAVTLDFENVVNQVAHKDMSWFFNEWIFQPGFPIYSYTFRREGGALVFYLKQERTNAPVFKMPVEFAAYFHGNDTIGSFMDSMAVQTFTMPFPYQPDSVVFDPDNKIMKQVITWSDTTMPYSSLSASNFPNPFKSTTSISYTIPVGTKVSLEIFDVLGREVRTIDEGYQEAGTYAVTFNGRALASGVYFCRITTGFGNRTIKFVLEK